MDASGSLSSGGRLKAGYLDSSQAGESRIRCTWYSFFITTRSFFLAENLNLLAHYAQGLRVAVFQELPTPIEVLDLDECAL